MHLWPQVTPHGLLPLHPPARHADSTSSAHGHLALSVQDIPVSNSLKTAPNLMDADGDGGREEAEDTGFASLHAVCSQPPRIYSIPLIYLSIIFLIKYVTFSNALQLFKAWGNPRAPVSNMHCLCWELVLLRDFSSCGWTRQCKDIKGARHKLQIKRKLVLPNSLLWEVVDSGLP